MFCIIKNRTKMFYFSVGGDNVKLDRKKYMLARARACMGQKDLVAAGIPKGTLCAALRGDVKPETAGKIAKALGVDVTEIIETEN